MLGKKIGILFESGQQCLKFNLNLRSQCWQINEAKC